MFDRNTVNNAGKTDSTQPGAENSAKYKHLDLKTVLAEINSQKSLPGLKNNHQTVNTVVVS